MAEPFDEKRARSMLKAAGLDALLLFQPEHIAYATGIHPGVAANFRHGGAAGVLIAADAQQPPYAVFPDMVQASVRGKRRDLTADFHPIWVEMAEVPPPSPTASLNDILPQRPAIARPATFAPDAVFRLIAARLSAMGLADGRIGFDAAFLPVADFQHLQQALPAATLADATDTIRRLRMVKTPAEIAKLRNAARLSDAGLAHALAAISEGVTVPDLNRAYAVGVEAAAAATGTAFSGLWHYISIGAKPWGAGEPARSGDIIKLDVGVVIDGYSSDMARTVSLGKPSRAASELHAALLAAFNSGLALMRPGVTLKSIHAAMMASMADAGIAGYGRGHFGHGLGNDAFSEQWPFIAADSDVVLEPGMVMALEAPHYVDGLGGFIIEDQVLITENGYELMTHLPREMRAY